MAFVNVSATSASQSSNTTVEDDSDRSEQRQLESSTNSVSSSVKQFPLQKSYKTFECGGKWWKSTVIYEVYVRSFYDSNNDGIGDLKGVEEKLEYFKHLGVDTLWLTPMYPSPMVDFGYDISDFIGIDPIFGTMEDFKKLLRSMKDKDMKLILDFVPNHTSDQHEWFKMSVLRQEPYTDYYVWQSPKEYDINGEPTPPSNWRSVFGGSAWTYNEMRKQYYLHQFAKEQPDLNFRNPLVIHEMINVLNFWLELGVDGFRLDAAPHILEDEEFRDNPQAILKEGNECKEDDYSFWDPVFTCNSPGVLDILTAFRNVCNEWSVKDAKERVLMTEGYLPLPQLMEYYGTPTNPIAHFSFNFELLGLAKGCNASNAFTCITRWLDALPHWCCPNWQTGNHDQPRIASKLGEDMVDIMNMILLLLPGVAVTYYGEEIGMKNTEISWEQTKDPAGKNAGPSRYHLFSRDGERSPMQWNASSNSSAGKL
ncbi:Maltase A3 [Orchesella cincta]|uniref:alpha-glucosidase n=1 Tax=Orchesella cincta TaxID=48709 RepID=A0A1D2MLG5_ORCCI|nr:Maltase A3 [Orchesella cincta]